MACICKVYFEPTRYIKKELDYTGHHAANVIGWTTVWKEISFYRVKYQFLEKIIFTHLF